MDKATSEDRRQTLAKAINEAERAVWYFRRSQDYYGIRWAHDALAVVGGLIEDFTAKEQVALDNAAHVVDSALKAADVVLTADYLEAGLIPLMLSLQAELLEHTDPPVPDRVRFTRNLKALYALEGGDAIIAEVFGDAFAKEAFTEDTPAGHITDEAWETALQLYALLEKNGYAAEYTATGDVTLNVMGHYLHTNNAPVIEGLTWGSRMSASSYRVYGAGLLYHIRGLQELFPGVAIDLYEANPAILAFALGFAPLAEMTADNTVQLHLIDEEEDAARRLFPLSDEETDPALKIRTHAPSVTTIQDKKTKEYLLRFGDRMGLSDGSSPKLVSVVIPCYNAEEVIDRCLLSVVKQTIGIDQIEVVCVDDASTDGTLVKLREWEHRYPVSFTIVEQQKNGRQGRARNAGVLHATTDHIFFLDADDWIEPETLEEMVAIARQTGVEVVAGTYGVDTGDGELRNIEPYGGVTEAPVYVTSVAARKELLRHGLHSNVSPKLFRRDIFSRYDLYFPEGVTFEDNYFGPLLKHTIQSYFVTDKAYYHWYMNPASTGTKRNEDYYFDRLTVEEQKIQALKERGLFNETYLEEIADDFVQKYYINSLHLFFTRFDDPPVKQFEHACDGLKATFPDIRSMEAYAKRGDFDKGLIDLAFEETSVETWQNLAKQYRDALNTESP